MADTMMPLEVVEALEGDPPSGTPHAAELLDLVRSGTPPEAAAVELGMSPEEGTALWTRLEQAARRRRSGG